MSFFVTGASKGDGANYGGIAGADQYCQMKASSVNAVGTWHTGPEHAGPERGERARPDRQRSVVQRAKGQRMQAQNISDLHGDTLEQARVGNAISKATVLDEKGNTLKGFGDNPNQHDILTGSQPDGRAYTDGARITPPATQLDQRQHGHGAARPLRSHRRSEYVVELGSSERGLQPGQPGSHRRRGELLYCFKIHQVVVRRTKNRIAGGNREGAAEEAAPFGR